MKSKILEINKETSLYYIALDIGISESSLYRFVNDYKIGPKIENKIREYLKERKNENTKNYEQNNIQAK